MKPVIAQAIVVEGFHDSAHLKRYFDCETIITGGSGITEEVMDEIRAAKQRCGVIVFTDPDSPGNAIRKKIDDAVPGCAHAYVMKEDARTEYKVGVEHASCEVLLEALRHVCVFDEFKEETISSAQFYELCLIGQEDSAMKRERLGRKLHIGYGSAKTMRTKLNRLGITEEEVRRLLEDE